MDSHRVFLFALLGLTVIEAPRALAQGQPASHTSAVTANQEPVVQTAAQLFALASASYAREDWLTAVGYFEQLSDRYPSAEQAKLSRFYAGEALMQLHRIADAQSAFAEYRDSTTDTQLDCRVHFRLAECHYLNRQWPDAKSHFQLVAQRYPDDPLIEFVLPYLGELLLQNQELLEAKAAYVAAIEKFPQSKLVDKCRLGLAQCLLQLNELSEAMRLCQFLTGERQNELADDALLLLGKLHASEEQFDAALSHFDQLKTIYPGSALVDEATYLAGRVFIAQRRWQDAIDELLPIATPDRPSAFSAEAMLAIAIAEKEIGQDLDALAHLQLIRDHWPEDGIAREALVRLIAVCADRNELARVNRLVGELESSDPTDDQLILALDDYARALYAAKEYSQAIETYTRLLKLVESTTQFDTVTNTWRYLLALAQLGAGDFEATLNNLSKIHPAASEIEMLAGIAFTEAAALASLGDFESAKPKYRDYLRLLPDGPDAIRCTCDLSIALLRTQDIPGAADVLQELRLKQPGNHLVQEACAEIAETALRTGELIVAREYFQSLAQAKSSEFADRGKTGLVWVAARQADQDLDAGDVLESVSDQKLAGEALLAYGQAIQETGDHRTAVSIFEKIVESDAAHDVRVTAQLRLAVSLLRCGVPADRQRAIELLRQLASQTEGEERYLTHYELAWGLLDGGNQAQAVSVFESIVNSQPKSPYRCDAIYRCAFLHREQGNRQLARDHFQRLLHAKDAGSLQNHAILAMGEMSLEDRDWPTAIEHFRSLLDREADQQTLDSARYWLGESLFQDGKPTEAERCFRDLQTRCTTNEYSWHPAVWLRLAQCAAQRKDWRYVELLVTESKERFPDQDSPYQLDYLQGRVLMSRALFEEARTVFQAIVTGKESRGTQTAAMAQWMIGECYFHQREFDDAITAYLLVEATYSFPKWQAISLYQAAKCFESINQPASAERTYRQLLESFPASDQAVDSRRRLQALPATYRVPASRSTNGSDR